MATFERLPSGAWRAKVRRKGVPQCAQTFDKKVQAQEWARSVEAQIDAGQLQDRLRADELTLHEALGRYSREVTPTKKGAQQELGRVKRWQRDPLASRPLGQIKPTDIAVWRDERLRNGTSPTTVRTDLALISHLFTTARREWSMPVVNPILDVRLPAPAKGRDRRLEPGEEERLLAACRRDPHGRGRNVTLTPWLEPAVQLAIETAMRLGEICSLKWKDVDLGNRTALLRDTKNGDMRRVPLSRAALRTLEAVERSAVEARVIPSSPAALYQAWRHACVRAGLDDLRFHDLRHEATSRLFERSDLRDIEIASITGHKTHAMLRRYANLRARELAARLD